MAIWLACDELDFNGAAVVAAAWLRRADRLLAPLDRCAEHGWLAFFAGYLAYAGGDAAAALAPAVRAAEAGRRMGIADLEMLGLALEGRALVACARVDEGMARLDEATATALERDAIVPISCAWTFCLPVTAYIDVRDHRRASEWCDRIAEFAERYRSDYMRGFCRAHYGAVHLWRGRWADAEAQLDAAVEAFGRSRPEFVPDARAWLAERRRPPGSRRSRRAAARGCGRQHARAALPGTTAARRRRRGRRRRAGRALPAPGRPGAPARPPAALELLAHA
jgi:hypothetical protein